MAARRGVGDPGLRELALPVWEVALAGAARLAPGYFHDEHLAVAERFLERFTRAGRMPSDELREAFARSPKEALEWAAGDAPCPDRGPYGKVGA